jgi:hypothetical protein
VAQEPVSGFLRALTALAEAGVAYVIVGVGGINFYARTPAQAYATLDLDVLLEPTPANLRRALEALRRLGYAFEAGREPFVDFQDEAALATIVRQGATLRALHPDAGEVDLLLSIAGSSYQTLATDAVEFRVSDVRVRVGALEKLLASKRASGRPKDVAFLRAFEAGASDEEDDRR